MSINFQYGRQNIEHVRKKAKANPKILNRVDSEDERNASGVNDEPSDTVDGISPSKDINEEFKKPPPPSELKPVKRKSHKKHNSNGNTVISREDALILVPDGVQNTDGFTFIRTPRGSDNENSDTEVKSTNHSKFFFTNDFHFFFFRPIIQLIFIWPHVWIT